MRLVMVGGGGFRTPLVYRALLLDAEPLVSEVVLYDIDTEHVAVIGAVLDQLAASHPAAPRVTVATDLDAALDGADFVFSAIRVGGLAGRVADERVALDLGVLGQETTGPGGVAFGLRTVPVAVDLAKRVNALAPDAWVINFTNPAGMITEAMRTVLGDRVIGICDSPMGLAQRAHRAVGLTATPTGDYAGLNHLGWLHSIDDHGVDRLPELLADRDRLLTIEEGQIFGPEWLQSIGALPNEYLYYFYFTREAIASTVEQTRGEYLLEQQPSFFAAVAAAPANALHEWNRVRTERNATYMEAARDGHERDDDDVDNGGYELVAVAVMRALAGGGPTELILNVANRGAIVGLDDDAVVEVPCLVDSAGARPVVVARALPGDEIGLVQQIKAVERRALMAALGRSVAGAESAFAVHPLVDSVTVARQLLAAYRLRIPELDAVFSDTAVV